MDAARINSANTSSTRHRRRFVGGCSGGCLDRSCCCLSDVGKSADLSIGHSKLSLLLTTSLSVMTDVALDDDDGVRSMAIVGLVGDSSSRVRIVD